MATSVHQRSGISCRLELDGVTRVGPAPHAPIEPANLADVVRAALEAPLSYPPLSAATVPGDRVAIALESGLPRMREIVAGVSRALADAGVDRALTTFVYSGDSGEGSESFSEWATEQGLRCERHDPSDENCCGMFGVSQAGHPLRLNRRLSEADIVLPIGAVSVLPTGERAAKFGGMYPQFSDDETIARHRGPEGNKPGESRRERRAEIEEAGWLLGVGMAVQVVPGADGMVAAVFAGDPAAVAEAAARKYREIWQRPVEAAGDLVIATLGGPTSEQTWENVGRAIVAAEAVLMPGSAIAVCTQLNEPLGLSLRRLAGGDEPERLERKLARDSGADSRAALAICQALQRGPVYFSSLLTPDVVEVLGFAPIAAEAELERLVKSYRRPLLLEDAQRLLPVLAK